MDAAERNDRIQRYREGYGAVSDALEGVTEAELDARPRPDEWTAREVVHHLGDSEMRAAMRLRQLLAEDDPVIQAYDEPEYARRLHYDRPMEASLELMRASRASTSELLDRMSESDWSRAGMHTESGPYTAETWLEIYSDHAFDHADQIGRARSS
jgi:DinB superfamily